MQFICNQIQGRRLAPSILQIVPFAQEFSMMLWVSLANYSTFPNLPEGVWLYIFFLQLSESMSMMGVRNIPGAIAITLILYFPKSLASGNTIPFIAPFVAPQIDCPFWPSVPAPLLTKMITPLSPLTSVCSDIVFAANLAALKVPNTLILNVFYMTQLLATPFEVMMEAIGPTPAEQTTASTFPKVCFVYSKSAFTWAQSVTSVLKKWALVYSATTLPFFSSKSAITTLAPRDVSNCTVAFPRPEVPPVTTPTKLLSMRI